MKVASVSRNKEESTREEAERMCERRRERSEGRWEQRKYIRDNTRVRVSVESKPDMESESKSGVTTC